MNRIKAVFLDRDGTINYEKNYDYKVGNSSTTMTQRKNLKK